MKKQMAALKFETLTSACAWLRAAGWEHNSATQSWHKDGHELVTRQSEVTRCWRLDLYR